MNPNLAGALLMMASMACFTLNDTLLKLIAAQIPLFQLIFLRSVITSLLIILTRGRLGALHFQLARRDWFFVGLRALTELVIAYFFLTALVNMPLANVTAILQVVPLAVTLASAIVLKEAVGWRRMLAIAIGFLGVMLIVKPGAEGFTIWSVYALIAVAGVTLRDLATRQLSPLVPSMTVTLITALTVTLGAGLASTTEPWVAVPTKEAFLIFASSIFILGGYFFSIQVMRTGDISFTAPFRYTGLVWALLLGLLVFGEWPGWLTLLGAAIVVGTGLFSLYRERKVSAS